MAERRKAEGRIRICLSLGACFSTPFLRFFGTKRISYASEITHLADGLAGFKSPGDFHDVLFAHAVDKQVRLAIKDDRPFNGVGPVIVMRETTQRRLDAASNYRHAREGLAGSLAVHKRRTIRSKADPPTRRIGVVVTNLLVRGVVVDERIHVPRADCEEQPRAAELSPGFTRLPVGLAQNRDAKPACSNDR